MEINSLCECQRNTWQDFTNRFEGNTLFQNSVYLAASDVVNAVAVAAAAAACPLAVVEPVSNTVQGFLLLSVANRKCKS